MKRTDTFHRWVEWSDEDKTYIGRCPDLITGIHGPDPVRLYAELCETVDDVIKQFEQEHRPLSQPRVRPMRDVC